MFIEITTKANEVIYLNVSKILYVLKTRKEKTLIVDVDGNEFSLVEDYKEFVKRLEQLKSSKSCKNVKK
jgi:hypothetical protein